MALAAHPPKNGKQKKLDAYFAAERLNFFHKRALHDDMDTAVYITAIPVGEYRLLAAVLTDCSIYTSIRCHLGDRTPGAADEADFLEALRRLNAAHAFFKYAMDEAGGLYLDVCLTAPDERFDPEMVRMTLNLMVYHLKDTFPALVKWLPSPGDAERELNGQ